MLFNGVDMFPGNKVLFVKGEPNAHLLGVVNYLRAIILEKGYSIDRDFRPHMTIHNTQRSGLRIDRKFKEMFSKTEFGLQMFGSIHLCLDGSTDNDTGFYQIVKSITWT